MAGMCFMLSGSTALAEIIDIFPTGTGWQIQRANGEILGNVTSQQAAQRAANVYTSQGNTVNWRSATPTTTSTSAVTTTGTSSGTTGSYISSSRQLTSGSKVPATTSSNLPATTTKPGTNLPATTTKPGTNLPATTTQPGQNVPASTGGNTSGGNTSGGGGSGGKSGGGTGVTTTASRVNVGGAALGILGMVSGGVGLHDSTASDEKANWGNVIAGAASGATFAAGTAAFINAIPVGGQIAYGASIAVGAVIGSMGAGAEMFSETDCEMDPVLGIYACCNISNLSNIDAYRAEIGDRMFADTFPYVRYCVQGKQEFKEEQPWLKGRFLDDHWSATTEVGLCPGYSMPVNQERTNIQLYAANDANVGYCWAWECADPGRTRVGGTCVGSDVADASMMGPFLPEGFGVGSVGENCDDKDLPQYATAGTYIDNGVDIVCAATACQSGTYLVVNSSGLSQGWCVASSYCTDVNTTLNIIDGTKTDLQCVSNVVADEELFGGTLDAVVVTACSNATLERLNATAAVYDATVDDCVPTACKNGYRLDGAGATAKCVSDTRNECERGVAGYVMFEGVCMPTSQMQQIQSQRQSDEIVQIQSQIDAYAKTIRDIEEAHDTDKVSVWKNAEGKFNTSRLLSDSIAGVALGTVGGLVVNKVVKDKHVETGFEELGCSVNGVKIADFDDDFIISGAVDKEGCLANNMGYGNVYVWASRFSNGTDYIRMTEDVSNPDNNACWVRVDIKSDNPKISVSDVAPRWFVVGQQVTCGDWTNRDTLRQRALDARKSARTWATVGGAVGGAGLGVGMMELFGNKLIGGKVMGQKSLDEAELLWSQMSESERSEYKNAAENLVRLCDELRAKGGTSSLCE